MKVSARVDEASSRQARAEENSTQATRESLEHNADVLKTLSARVGAGEKPLITMKTQNSGCGFDQMPAFGEQFDTKLAANTLNFTATCNQKLSNVVTHIAKMPSLIADFDKQLEMVKVRLSGAISEWSDHQIMQADTNIAVFNQKLSKVESRIEALAGHAGTVDKQLVRWYS